MKTFYHLLANSVLASITNSTVWFALVFYVYLQTRSVFATGIISGLYFAAVALTGFWFGHLVDRHSKKQMMLISSLVSLVFFFIALLLYLFAPDNAFTNPEGTYLWLFITVTMVGVIAGNIRGIVLPTLVTILVSEDTRDKANGLVGTANGISFLITSAISGVLVGLSGMQLVLILSVVFTLLVIADLVFIHLPSTEPSSQPDSAPEPQKLNIRATLAIISSIPGLLPIILFTTFNNFLGGVFGSLMDAYGLSLVSVQVWGFLWAFLSTGFIVGGMVIAKRGLGRNPVISMFLANTVIWLVASIFTLNSSIILTAVGMYIYLGVFPFIEAAEHTIIQKVVPADKQGRVFGFAQSVEQAASPITSFVISPLTQFVFIPFMTDGAGARVLGPWFGTGPARGMALVFTLTGLIGLIVTLFARRSRSARALASVYEKT